MKQIFLSLAVIFALLSCSKDNNENGVNDNAPQQQVSLQPPFGVWESDKFFLSLSYSGDFYAAYIDDTFIDCGSFKYDGSKIECTNQYFNRRTTYMIKEYDGNNLKVDVTYTNTQGNTYSKTISFRKSDKAASIKDAITGHSWSEQWWNNNMELFKTYSLTSYCSGISITDHKEASDYPMSLFYVYHNDTVYYQLFNQKQDAPLIDGWNDTADTGIVHAHNLKGR